MTAKAISRVREQRRNQRRNLKRYLYTQSFTRISGMECRVDGSASPEEDFSRSVLGAVSFFLVGTGLFFVIF